MGKFEGILLCTDLDDTLLTTDKKISEDNKRMIEYFKAEGGMFSFATGRILHGARIMMKYAEPNVPMICFNGAAVYDHIKDEILWKLELGDDAVEVMEFVDKNMPFSGLEVCTDRELFICKTNMIVEEHKRHEQLNDNYADYHDVPRPWIKALFMQNADKIDIVRDAIGKSEFTKRFDFIQSSPQYYELLPKNASKGNALLKLAQLLNVPIERVIAIGDNENDISMIKAAGIGIAVANAIPALKEEADFITVDNNSSAVATVISMLDSGKLRKC